ncbi:hypothetical protein KBC89_02205 [Candidatus Woesebacteria bacterium]|nr:hypothetical protein [Candidatus Woesebacteria bacterium]
MNDYPTQSTSTAGQALPQDVLESPELSMDRPSDLGEASPPPSKSELAKDIERQEKVEAGFEIVLDIRNSVVAQGAISKDEADRFQLLSVAPRAETILNRYLVVCNEIADKQDAPEEIVQLKAEQAELYLAYAYNTVALLESHYKKMMLDIISKASQQIQENAQPDQELNTRLSNMLQVATLIESFRSNSEKLVPELVKQYPKLQVACVALNADLLKYLGQTNQLKDSVDQSTQELSRFVGNLTKTINFDKLQRIQVLLQEQAERQSRENSTQTTSAWAEPMTTAQSPAGWTTDAAGIAQEPVVSDLTNSAGDWQSPDATQPDQSVHYVDPAVEPKQAEVLSPIDELNKMREEAGPPKKAPND